MKTTTKKLRVLAIILVLSLIVPGFSGITTTTAEAAVTASGIIYDGEGEVTKTLSNGKTAEVSLANSIISITVSGEKYGYYSTSCVGTCVISDDDLLHIFWHTGHYYVYDLYESGCYILAGYKSVSGKNVSYYVVSDPSDTNIVKGTSAPNSLFHSCIIDKTYFYMYGQTMKKALMTRAEFEELVYGTTTETPEPTVPTEKPTVQPIVKPTEAPSTDDSTKPSTTPDVEIDTEIKFDIEFWWEQYTAGKITWEQFSQIVWEEQWKVETSNTETETTYYFYDDEGKLIKTERVLHSTGSETGVGSGSAEVEVSGSANYQETNTGKGEVKGTASATTKIYVNSNAGSKSTCKTSKDSWHVRRRTKKVQLTRTVNGKTGIVCTVYFNKKKGIAKFDGIKYKNIKYVGYTSKSRQIILLKKNGKVLIIPRAKGKIGKVYTAKKLKGKWKLAIENPAGLTIRVSNGVSKVKGVKNAKPKKLK